MPVRAAAAHVLLNVWRQSQQIGAGTRPRYPHRVSFTQRSVGFNVFYITPGLLWSVWDMFRVSLLQLHRPTWMLISLSACVVGWADISARMGSPARGPQWAVIDRVVTLRPLVSEGTFLSTNRQKITSHQAARRAMSNCRSMIPRAHTLLHSGWSHRAVWAVQGGWRQVPL